MGEWKYLRNEVKCMGGICTQKKKEHKSKLQAQTDKLKWPIEDAYTQSCYNKDNSS